MMTVGLGAAIRRPDAFTRLHVRGATAGPTFYDLTGKTATVQGSPTGETAKLRFGTGPVSMLFTYTTQANYINFADSTQWDVLANEFTLDFWYASLSTGMSAGLCGQARSNNGLPSLFVEYVHSIPRFALRTNYGSIVVNNITLESADLNYHHWCVMRQHSGASSYVRVFRDGVAIWTSADLGVSASHTVSSSVFSIGMNGANDAVSRGYFQEFRLSIGVVRYNFEGFTPPTCRK